MRSVAIPRLLIARRLCLRLRGELQRFLDLRGRAAVWGVIEVAAHVADHLAGVDDFRLAPFPGRDRVLLAPEPSLAGTRFGLEPRQIAVVRANIMLKL